MMQPDEGWGSRHRTVPTGPFQQPRPFFDRNAIGKRALKSKFIPLAAKYPAVRRTAVGAGGCSLDMAATTAKGGPVDFIANWQGSVSANGPQERSEEHTSELQSLMRISYAVFFLKKKK